MMQTPNNLTFQRREEELRTVQREILALPVTALTTAGVTVYTVPDAASLQVQHFAICNYTATDRTFDMHIVPSGGSAATSNAVYYGVTVSGNYTSTPYERWGLVAPAGSSIVFVASANSALNVLLSGMTVYSGDLI